jgi:N6-adenosine-specific RNA methylase IME4
VSDAKKIKEEAPELFEAVRSGETTVSAAMRKVRMEEPPPERVETPGFPDGPFRTLVIDPPWPMQKVVLERRAAEKTRMDYATWTLDEIGELPVGRLADSRGAHVYLWVTHKFLPEGLRLFEQWGVRYECLLTWNKPTAQPLWWRFLTEHCLFGKVGSLPLRKKGMAVSFAAPQQKHSHKPEEFYELVRTVSPGPRLTLFDYDRDGFQRWGITH